MIKIRKRSMHPLGLLYVCNMHGPLWFFFFFKDFMALANKRCTPMGMGKIFLEQDVSFGT